MTSAKKAVGMWVSVVFECKFSLLCVLSTAHGVFTCVHGTGGVQKNYNLLRKKLHSHIELLHNCGIMLSKILARKFVTDGK